MDYNTYANIRAENVCKANTVINSYKYSILGMKTEIVLLIVLNYI